MILSWIRQLREKQNLRWALNCDFHNWTIHDLRTNEASVILETLRDSEKASVLVWRTGWTNWKSLREPECSVLLHTRHVQLSAPPLPAHEDFNPEITAVRPIKPETPFHTRKSKRFDVSYPVQVISGTQEFSSVIEDLSEGGLRVRDALPEWVAGYCTVIFTVENGSKIEVMCSLAEDQKQSKTRLEIVPSEKHAAFLEWFKAQTRFQG